VPAARTAPAAGRAKSERVTHAAIEKAKLDWEGTADALGSLVCLLTPEGRITRVNRVVEDWSLGTVAGVRGCDVHGVLHPGCEDEQCALHRFISRALAAIPGGRHAQIGLHESIGTRFLHFVIRPMRARARAVAQRGDACAVLVAEDLSALHRARLALERLNSSLEERVRTRTAALADANRDLRNEVLRREQAEVALRTSRNELLALSEQLIDAQEVERKRIAVELHDSVGQSLSALKYTLERGLELLRQPQLGDPAEVFRLAMQRLQESAEDVRSIAINLRPKILDDLGAVSAAQWLCRQFSETYPSIQVTMDVAIDDGHVPDRLATVVYRALQELLNNVAKHSGARQAAVKLTLDDGTLMLQVRDNGVGLDKATAESRRHGMGLRNLRERAQMTGGQFAIGPAPGRGTLATLSWPLTSTDSTGDQPRLFRD
jgi:signal transduction histidine kinase